MTDVRSSGRVGRRRTAFGRLIRRPADAWIVLRLLPWALALPALKYVVPLPRLARLMWARPVSARRDRECERRVAALVRGLSGTLTRDENCLERSLLAYRFLSRLGADPRLVAGVRRDTNELIGHVWVTVDGEPVGEPPGTIADFARVVVFGPSGITERPG